MTIDDQRHEDNQRRFGALESKIDTLANDTADLVSFIRDARVGLRWSARVGRFLGTFGKIILWALAAYGAWKTGGAIK